MSISQIPSGWTITRSDERIVVQHVSGSFYAAAKEGDSGIAESILYMLADSLLNATLSPAHIEDEREACERWIRQRSGMPAHIPMDWDVPFNRYTWAAWSARAALSAPPASGQQQTDAELLHLIDHHRIELLPEYDAGYTAIAYCAQTEPIAQAVAMTARGALEELANKLQSAAPRQGGE